VRCLFYLAFTAADLSAPSATLPHLLQFLGRVDLAATIVRELVGDIDRLTRGIRAKA
jgi:hypothetical protein